MDRLLCCWQQQETKNELLRTNSGSDIIRKLLPPLLLCSVPCRMEGAKINRIGMSSRWLTYVFPSDFLPKTATKGGGTKKKERGPLRQIGFASEASL